MPRNGACQFSPAWRSSGPPQRKPRGPPSSGPHSTTCSNGQVRYVEPAREGHPIQWPVLDRRAIRRGISDAARHRQRGERSEGRCHRRVPPARGVAAAAAVRDERGVRRAGQPRHAARRGHGDLLGVQALRRHRRREHQAAKLNRPGRRAAPVPLLDIMAQAARECRGRHVHLGLPCTRRFSGRRVPGRGTRLRPSTGRPRTCLHLTAHKNKL